MISPSEYRITYTAPSIGVIPPYTYEATTQVYAFDETGARLKFDEYFPNATITKVEKLH